MFPMGRPEFETSSNMKTVGLIIRLTRALCSTGKAVIMDSGFCVLKGLLEMRKRTVCGSTLIKIVYVCLRGFMETVLTIGSGQNILVMWDV